MTPLSPNLLAGFADETVNVKSNPDFSRTVNRSVSSSLKPHFLPTMTPLSSERFQELHTRLSHLGTHFLHYVQELRSGQIQEGRSTQSIDQINNNLENLLEALDRQTYEVAVIAAMKAGKSTLLNVIIGADVLASESEACTVCRTEIRHLNPGTTPYLLEYRANQSEPVLIAEGDGDVIRQAFLQRTHEIRKTNTVEEIEYFELHHPIVAIQDLKVLSGFTLIDTPGPNEWQTDQFNTVHLRQIALEVLRSCQIILFVLDYTSFRDSVNQDLLSDLIENRQGFLNQDRDKIYFLLNKVDRRAENDRPLDVVVAELKETLQGFGIPNPKVYTSSARQGLLARLIEQGQAKDDHLKDHKKFFSAQYAEENEDGDLVIPSPRKIAPRALQDSGIPEIEESIIGTIAQNAGVALLRDILGQFSIAANEMEILLQTSIQGWNIAVEELEEGLQEYAAGADRARMRLDEIKKNIITQQNQLTQTFNTEVNQFAQQATQKISQEIDAFVNQLNARNQSSSPAAGRSLIESLLHFFRDSSVSGHNIEFDSEEQAERAYDQINKCCTPIIQEFWLTTQDKLVRDGNSIRGQVAREIEQEIQVLSDELTILLGECLEIDFKPTPIKIPDYNFPGIDQRVEEQRRQVQETRDRCCTSPESYTIEISSYVINFQEVKRDFEKAIRRQKLTIQGLIEKVVNDQIQTDLDKAQQQFEDSFERVERELQHIIQKRSDRSMEVDQAIVSLKEKLAILQQYYQEIDRIKADLGMS